MAEKLNFFWPSTVKRCQGSHYIRRPWFKNQLAEEFDLRLFCKVEECDDIDREKYLKLSEVVTVVDFFAATNSTHFVRNYFKYRRDIKRHTDMKSDLYLVMYPYRKTSVFLTKILSETKLSIWVKSDYVGLFGVPADPPLKSILKKAIKPAISILYPRVTEALLKSNIVFYTGDIIYDTNNHRTQYSITSLSPLNEDPDRIREEMENDVVFIGSESNQKGLEFLLEALKRVDLDLELTIIGIDELNRYDQYYDEFQITTVGAIYDHESFYDCLSDHDILVMPSICERQGKVQLEAMSTGVVPICADSGGTYTTIDNLYNGVLFEEKNIAELEESIKKIYKLDNIYSTLQQNGLEYVENKNVRNQVEEMSTIIRNHYC